MIPAWLVSPAVRYGAVALISGSAVWWLQASRWDAKVSKINAAHSQQMANYADAAAKSANDALAETQRRITAQEKTIEESTKRAAIANAGRLDAERSANGLRKRISEISASLTSFDPSLADGSPARAGNADLLSYMLDRLIERATGLANVADRARNAGLTCEKFYDSLRQ